MTAADLRYRCMCEVCECPNTIDGEDLLCRWCRQLNGGLRGWARLSDHTTLFYPEA